MVACTAADNYLVHAPGPPDPELLARVRGSPRMLIGGKRSAVVLDETPEARAMIATALRNGGFDVLEATTGAEAIELAHSHALDLIIANPIMAGMDSDEFTLALGVDPVITRTPVVFCASTDDARAVWCLAEACDVSRILIKPCEPDDVTRFVGEIFGSEPDAGPTA